MSTEQTPQCSKRPLELHHAVVTTKKRYIIFNGRNIYIFQMTGNTNAVHSKIYLVPEMLKDGIDNCVWLHCDHQFLDHAVVLDSNHYFGMRSMSQQGYTNCT